MTNRQTNSEDSLNVVNYIPPVPRGNKYKKGSKKKYKTEKSLELYDFAKKIIKLQNKKKASEYLCLHRKISGKSFFIIYESRGETTKNCTKAYKITKVLVIFTQQK